MFHEVSFPGQPAAGRVAGLAGGSQLRHGQVEGVHGGFRPARADCPRLGTGGREGQTAPDAGGLRPLRGAAGLSQNASGDRRTSGAPSVSDSLWRQLLVYAAYFELAKDVVPCFDRVPQEIWAEDPYYMDSSYYLFAAGCGRHYAEPPTSESSGGGGSAFSSGGGGFSGGGGAGGQAADADHSSSGGGPFCGRWRRTNSFGGISC